MDDPDIIYEIYTCIADKDTNTKTRLRAFKCLNSILQHMEDRLMPLEEDDDSSDDEKKEPKTPQKAPFALIDNSIFKCAKDLKDQPY